MPSQASFRLLRQRVLRVKFLLAAVGLILVLVLYCSLRVYAGYIARRAMNLLDETAHIQIGATEESILPLVSHFGAVKWNPESPESIDDCVDKAGCEYHNAHLSDYAYEVDIAPFNVLSRRDRGAGRFHRALTALMIGTPSSWRDPFSLRDWNVFAQIRIRGGHVEGVYSGLFVEGRSRWLGDTWELSSEMRDPEKRSKSYYIEGSMLSFPGDGGEGIIQLLTSATTTDQLRVAHSFNPRCLSGLIPCRRLCDLAPRTFEYLKQHPESGNVISSEGCLDPITPGH